MQDSKPRTAEEARAFGSRVESFVMPWDIDGLLAGFTDDCVVRFGDIPEFRGKAPLERLFRARSERQRDYRLRKELRALMGDTIVKLLAGVDHVGLGSDMRGSTGPSVFDSYRDPPVLAQKLLAQGFAAADVGKILGGNYARVFAATVG